MSNAIAYASANVHKACYVSARQSGCRTGSAAAPIPLDHTRFPNPAACRAGEDGSSILDYIKLKSAVTEAEKRVTDLRRKVEVAGSAGAGGGTWNSRRRQ